MNKYKYLLKNIGILTIGSFSTKILTFLLIPFYTGILSTEEYGSYDLISTIVTLFLPILSLNIAEGVLRFSVDNSKNGKIETFMVGVKYTGIGIFAVVMLLLFHHMLGLSDIIEQYSIYLAFLYMFQSVLQLFVNFARGLGRMTDIAIGGVISSITTILLNLFLMGWLKLGIDGYFVANIAGTGLTCCYYIIRLKLWDYFDVCRYNKKNEKQMVVYSLPLIFNAIGWWINNSSDRLIVTLLCGVSVNGIYSVAYKIPAIVTVFQNIFNQAWMLSSVKEFDKEDKNGFFRNVYAATNGLMCILCFALITCSKPIAYFLFANDFYQAWIYSPMLTFAVIFGTLAGTLGAVFNSVHATGIVGYSTCAGAIVNTVLNIVLVHRYGAIGAAVSTAVSAVLVWLIRVIKIKSYINLVIDIRRDCLVYLILVLQMILLYSIHDIVLYSVISFAVFMGVACLFFREMKIVLAQIKENGK